ncbi:glycosyltransferase family 4 protein [Tardisphaera miroshnichenkoae]
MEITCLLASPAHPLIGQPRTAASLRKAYPPEGVKYRFLNGKVPRAPGSGEYAVTKGTALKLVADAFRAQRFDDNVDLSHFVFWYLPRAATSFWTYWLPGLLEKRIPKLAGMLERFAKPWVQENDTSVSQFLEGYVGDAEGKWSWLVELSSEVLNSKTNRGLITWSNWAAKGFENDGVEREKINVVPLPMEARPKPAEAYRKPAGSQKTVLFVGLDYWRKGGDIALRTLKRVKKEVPNFKLIYVGRVPGDRVNDYKLDWIERYDFLERDKLLKLYSSADVFFMPTRAEAYGLSILEAMASGTPVVSTKIAAIPEIVPNGAGFLTNDEDEMMERIADLLSDEELNQKVGTSAAKVVAQRHEPRSVSKQVYSVYVNALGL